MTSARRVKSQWTFERRGISSTIVISIAALGLGFGRDAMDRVANHRTAKVTDVYDRHGYADEDKRIMAAVARHVTGIVDGTAASIAVSLR